MIPRVLTVRAQRAGPGTLELTCSALSGNVAAALEWPDDAPVAGLAEAVVAAVTSSGFTGLKEPLAVWNLRLLKPDGTLLDLGSDESDSDVESSPLPLLEQLGLEPSCAEPPT